MRPIVQGPANSFAVGATIGSYTVLDSVDSLGFDQAFNVFNTALGRLEIMRVMPKINGVGELAARRFLKEAGVLRSLDHPNIVKSYDLEETEDNLVLTMEFNEGTSLDRLLAEQAVSQPDGLRYVSDVLAGLACAHRANIVHRCIAPSTIRVLPDGSAKLDGFTYALTADDIRLTARGFAIGFARYMSPEQVEGRRDLDARSDLYSVGAVLYELLTGSRPFSMKNQFQLMQAQLKERVAAPSSLQGEIPRELDAIVLKALAKAPAERFQSAEEFISALNEIRRVSSDQDSS